MFKLNLEKAEQPEIKLPTSVGELSYGEISISFGEMSLTLDMQMTPPVWQKVKN